LSIAPGAPPSRFGGSRRRMELLGGTSRWTSSIGSDRRRPRPGSRPRVAELHSYPSRAQSFSTGLRAAGLAPGRGDEEGCRAKVGVSTRIARFLGRLSRREALRASGGWSRTCRTCSFRAQRRTVLTPTRILDGRLLDVGAGQGGVISQPKALVAIVSPTSTVVDAADGPRFFARRGFRAGGGSLEAPRRSRAGLHRALDATPGS